MLEETMESPRMEHPLSTQLPLPVEAAMDADQPPFLLDQDESRKVLPPAEKPRWVPDEEESACYCCQTPFSFFMRRHHCRGCGHIFCHPCTDWWLLPPAELEYNTVQRLCETCFSRLSSIDYSRTYDAWGSPEDPAIVLIHGASGTRRNWAVLGDALAKRGYYAISIDMPGHGSRYREKLTMDSAMEAIADAVRTLVPSQRAFVMGGSMGGYIAMTFGARHLDLCRGLIIGQAGTDMKNSRTMLNWMTRYYRIVPRKTKATLIKQFHKSYPLYAEIEDEVMNELFLRTGVFLDCWPDIVELMAGEDYDEHMKAVGDLPVLFINGEIDFREAEMKWLNATKNGRLEIIKEAGHMCTVDPRYRDEVKEIMLDFMDETLAKRDHDEDDDAEGHQDGVKAATKERHDEHRHQHDDDDKGKGKEKESGETDEVAA